MKGKGKIGMIMAVVVSAVLVAFIPNAVASVTDLTITPNTGVAGKVVAYNITLNATPWQTLNITIPAGFEAVAPTTGGKLLAKVEFYDSSGAWCGNITIESSDSNPSTQVKMTAYNKTGAPSDVAYLPMNYNPGATTEFVPEKLSELFPTWNASVNLTLPTETKNGSLNISLPSGKQLTNVTVSLGPLVRNPTKAGTYTFVADGQTATVTISSDAPSKWYIDTPFGNSTIGNSIWIRIYVADQYGNINNTFSESYNGTVSLTVTEGTVTASVSPDATVKLNATNRNTTKRINVSDVPAKVKVEVWGGGLTAAEEVLEYYAGVASIELTLVKTELYANNTDTTILTAQLKDANGNDIKVQGVPITVSEYTTLDLKFNGSDMYTANTDSDGKATFTVKAGTKAGTATIRASIESGSFAGTSGETNLTLKQAPNATNTGNTIATVTAITAGVGKVITATLKDYNNSEIKNAVDFPIEFNITSGDAKWLESDGKVHRVTSDGKGNVSATLYSKNASAANRINVTISVKNETGGWETVKTISNINVVAGVPTKLEISPKKSVGLTNVKGTSQVFTLQLQDAYGNDNTSAESPVLITTDNEALGNMTCIATATTTVNNNLWCNITAGNTTFKYTVNSTVPGTAKLTVNVTKFGIIDTITITTTGPTGLNLTVDKKLPLVGRDSVTATAQLTALVEGKETDIAIRNVTITFTLLDSDGNLVDYKTNNTDDTGAATCTFSPRSTPGTYTIQAANATHQLFDTNTTTYVGNATQIWIAVNNTNPQVNETISVYAIFKDEFGYNTSAVDGDRVTFIVNYAEFANETIRDGVASATYTPTEPGDVTLYVFYTNVTNPRWEGVTPSNSTIISVGRPAALKNFFVSITPSDITVNKSTIVYVNVTDAETREPVEGATVDLSGCGVEMSNTTNASGIAAFEVKATSTGNITVTVSKTGYNTWTKEDGIVVRSALMEGDVDMNGCVNILDAMFIAQYTVEQRTLNESQLKCADTNDDGNVDILDAMLIAQYTVDSAYKPLWESPADDDMMKPVPCA